MLKYAEIINQSGFVKQAWTWRDIVEELGLSAVIDAGIIGGAALLGATVTTGGVALAILGGAALSMAIWSFTKQMDDNLSDLINRLEALDPNKRVAGVVNNWIRDLESFKPVMQIPQSSPDPKVRAKVNGDKLTALSQLEKYMKTMLSQWSSDVKPNLTDWGWDAAQAEDALNKTMAKVTQAIQSTKQYAQSEGQTVAKNVAKKVQEKKQKDKGVAGKGPKKQQQIKSPYILGLQRAINEINSIINAGSGNIIESGQYDWTTGNGLAGILSSNWGIARRIAQNTKVNVKVAQDIEFMRKNPRLLQKLYRELSSIATELKERAPSEVGVPRKEQLQERPISKREYDPSDVFEGYQGTKRLFF